MSEADFFNTRLQCEACGARNWRVWLWAAADRHDRELVCRECGGVIHVTVERVGEAENEDNCA